MFAYVTLVTNADYVIGATALARSLLAVNAQAPLLVLCPDVAVDVSPLEALGCRIVPAARPVVSDAFVRRHGRAAIHTDAPFTKGNKPSFHEPLDNFVKLALWRLSDFERVVFLDSDVVVVKNIDRLFGYPEFCAAPNLYETLADMHRLNSGVFVARPDPETLDRMIVELDRPGAYWRRTDQTFLQSFFPDWHGLPYTFNVMQYLYFNLPELWHWPSINVVHFQYEKPWASDHPKADRLRPLIDLWQQIFDTGTIPEHVP